MAAVAGLAVDVVGDDRERVIMAPSSPGDGVDEELAVAVGSGDRRLGPAGDRRTRRR